MSKSPSPSASPSTGYTGYTKGNYVALPADDTDLETAYDENDVTNVSTSNNVRVEQTAEDQYAIHQFKNFVGAISSCQLTCETQTNIACSLSTVYLQIYNHDSNEWETIDSDNTSEANTDFILSAHIADLTDYKNEQNIISCRVYQFAE